MIQAYFLAFIAVLFLFPAPASSKFITSAEEFSLSHGIAFSWAHAQSRSVKILLEYRDKDLVWRRVNLGSGFLLSADGLFVTAYHVMKYCLTPQRDASGLSVQVDCSTAQPSIRYVAVNDGREFPIEIIAHLKESESTNGKEKHSPDEIIKQRDFVVGKIKAEQAHKFSFWRLRDFDNSTIDTSDSAADFDLTPLLPPKRVFIAGFPSDHDFVISEGYLNLTEKNRRGYFAADLEVYSPAYLEKQGLAKNTRWGMRVENHMSGGAVVDAAGYIVGLVVNGDRNTAGVLSIENLLATFFSRADTGAGPAVTLNPNNTPLFLKQNVRRETDIAKSEPAMVSLAPANPE